MNIPAESRGTSILDLVDSLPANWEELDPKRDQNKIGYQH
jgi:hypothetical protein